MAEIILADPALEQRETIAEYIALGKFEAGAVLVEQVFGVVERLV